jgi:hypothetical protein
VMNETLGGLRPCYSAAKSRGALAVNRACQACFFLRLQGATNGRRPHLAKNERDMGHPSVVVALEVWTDGRNLPIG